MKFGDEEVLFKLECEWRAHLMQNKDGKYGFSFSEISNLMTMPCLALMAVVMPRKIIELVSGQGRYLDCLLLNKIIFKWMGYAVKNEAVHRHIYNKRITKMQEYIGGIKDSEKPYITGLCDPYKAIIGACCSLETTDEGFVFDYTVTGNKLDYIAFLWPSQIKALEYYSDLIFTDSTFGVSIMDYKALNVTVVDKHFRSVLEATAFVSGGGKK